MGTQFTSKVFRKLCEKFTIQKLDCSAKHPQTNGKSERFIRFLTNALATIVRTDQTDWDVLIDDCLMAYRVTINATIQETPFFLLYGRDAILPGDMVFNIPNPGEGSDGLYDYKLRLLNRLKQSYEAIELTQDEQVNYSKKRNDSRHKHVEFEVG